MKFGKSWDEVEAEPVTSGGYIKYFKDGETTFRIVQEPSEWIGYWEHFNPGGFSFPCTGDRQKCPGCVSDNEKMKKASRKIAINVLEGEYVNVYKFPKTLADKLANRAERIGTIMDRDYTIVRIKSKNADGSVKVDYDLEGGDKIPVDVSKLELKDVEAMLAESFDQSWGDSDKVQQSTAKADEASEVDKLRARLAEMEAKPKVEPKPAPSEPSAKQDPVAEGTENKVWTEAELRALPLAEIKKVVKEEGMDAPDLDTTDQVVDWLLDQ